MIYITPAIVLAQTPEEANAGWIGYRNILNRDNTTSSSEDAEHPVVNLVNNTTHQFWEAEDDADQWVRIADASANVVDYFALAKHNLGSTGATITLQKSADGSSWTDVVDAVAPGNDYSIMYRFEAQSANFWRLLIASGTAAPQIAVMHLGALLVLQRRLYVGHTPLPLGRWANTVSGASENNQFLGRVTKARGLKSAVSLQNLTPAWYRTDLDPFFEAAMENTAFFWAWRPADYPTEVGYAWLDGDVNVSNQRPNGMMQASFSMKGVR
jgi:hypothetical protein